MEERLPHQDALTIVARVDPQREAQLAQVLRTLQDDPAHNDVLPFAALPGCHFGRVLHLPGSLDLDGTPVEPQLMMLSDCDGPAAEHLQQLVDVAGAGLDRLFGHCLDYPRAPTTRAERVAFLRDKALATPANYVHRQGRTVEQIKQEAELRQLLLRFVAEQRWSGVPAREVRERIRLHLSGDPTLRWALASPGGVDALYTAKNALHFLTLPAGLIALGPLIIPASLLVLGLVRLQELRDRPEHVRPTPEHVRKLAELEDFAAHNGFTAGGFVKPGWVRSAVLRSVIPLIGWGTRHLFTRDSLAGVKSIHFARWIPLDGGRRVVFASNYDGSLESYNNDFIDLVAWGLNLVFSNGFGYPATRWLVFGGASYEQEFKDYLRRHQIPTPVWYSAYPQLTAINVERNAKLRAGLRGTMDESEARQWLNLL